MNGTLDDLLKTETDQRLFRLFAVGCCRQIWPLIKDERSKMAVEVAERYADGQTTRKELRKAYYAANAAAHNAPYNQTYNTASAAAYVAAYAAANAAAYAAANAAAHAAAYYASRKTANTAVYLAVHNAARQKQLELYHCLFTKIVFSITSQNAINLAKLIYLEHQWNLMPILGDALEEAGVSEEAVSHCKEKEHARGCWVVDNLKGLCASRTNLC